MWDFNLIKRSGILKPVLLQLFMTAQGRMRSSLLQMNQTDGLQTEQTAPSVPAVNTVLSVTATSVSSQGAMSSLIACDLVFDKALRRTVLQGSQWSPFSISVTAFLHLSPSICLTLHSSCLPTAVPGGTAALLRWQRRERGGKIFPSSLLSSFHT